MPPDGRHVFFKGKVQMITYLHITKSFSNPLIFNLENFLGLHQSASYCPTRSEENYSKYMESLTNFFESHCRNGLLTLENNTHCYIGYV